MDTACLTQNNVLITPLLHSDTSNDALIQLILHTFMIAVLLHFKSCKFILLTLLTPLFVCKLVCLTNIMKQVSTFYLYYLSSACDLKIFQPTFTCTIWCENFTGILRFQANPSQQRFFTWGVQVIFMGMQAQGKSTNFSNYVYHLYKSMGKYSVYENMHQYCLY